jgi:hypothetical protein
MSLKGAIVVATTFRGKPACTCLAQWLPAYEQVLLRRGVVKESIDIYQLIGGAKASAGTHSTGGAYDIAQVSAEAIRVAREMGAAAWHRPRNWDGKGGIAHQHGVLNGCPHNGPARYQITAYQAGKNGLAGGGKDTGPRVMPLRTWKQGITWAKSQAAPPVAKAPAGPAKAKPAKVPAKWGKFAHLLPYRRGNSLRGLKAAARKGYKAVDLDQQASKGGPKLTEPAVWKPVRKLAKELGVEVQVKSLTSIPGTKKRLKAAKTAGLTTIVLPRGVARLTAKSTYAGVADYYR